MWHIHYILWYRGYGQGGTEQVEILWQFCSAKPKRGNCSLFMRAVAAFRVRMTELYNHSARDVDQYGGVMLDQCLRRWPNNKPTIEVSCTLVMRQLEFGRQGSTWWWHLCEEMEEVEDGITSTVGQVHLPPERHNVTSGMVSHLEWVRSRKRESDIPWLGL